MLRIAIVTNVIVSGILSRKGAPAELLNAWRERRFLMLAFSAIIAEQRAVMQYPHIRKNTP
jgi:predicted nucleic acid-binding protein